MNRIQSVHRGDTALRMTHPAGEAVRRPSRRGQLPEMSFRNPVFRISGISLAGLALSGLMAVIPHDLLRFLRLNRPLVYVHGIRCIVTWISDIQRLRAWEQTSLYEASEDTRTCHPGQWSRHV